MTFDEVRRLALALPEMEDGFSYGTPALKVRGKFVCRLREDGETLALRVDFLERETLMSSYPEAFFVTDHYLNYPAVCVRLNKVRREILDHVVTGTWRQLASKATVEQFEQGRGPASRSRRKK